MEEKMATPSGLVILWYDAMITMKWGTPKLNSSRRMNQTVHVEMKSSFKNEKLKTEWKSVKTLKDLSWSECRTPGDICSLSLLQHSNLCLFRISIWFLNSHGGCSIVHIIKKQSLNWGPSCDAPNRQLPRGWHPHTQLYWLLWWRSISVVSGVWV